MAARRRGKTARRRPADEAGLTNDPKSLPSALRWAVERLVRIEGGFAAAARRLTSIRERIADERPGFTMPRPAASRLRRWVHSGIPDRLAENRAEFEATLMVVYDALRYWDETQRQELRDEILEYSKLPDAERGLAAERLGKLVRDIDEADKLMKRRPRGAQSVAARIGVKPSRLKRWLKEGMVSRDGLADVLRWEETQKKMFGPEAKRQMRHLMALARKPGTMLSGKPDSEGRQRVVPADRIGPFKGQQGSIQSQARSGYQWTKRIGDYLSEATLAEMVQFARSVKIPAAYSRAKRSWNRWMLTAVQVEYSPEGAEPLKADKSDRNKVRQFGPDGPAHGGGTKKDNELGRNMVINQGRSGGTASTKEKAIALFETRMSEWMALPVLCWVQGVIVSNWRDRTPTEEAAFLEARYERAQLEARRAKARKARKKKKAAKKKRRARTRLPRVYDVDADMPEPQPRARRTKKKGKPR